MGFLGINGIGGNQDIPPKSSKQKAETEQLDLSSLFATIKPVSVKELCKVSKVETVIENGKKVETAYNSMGQVIRTSVFADRNSDGNFDNSEAISIKFYHPTSKSSNTKEYRDTDNDGYYDEIVESDWTGNETIHKLNQKFKTDELKMSNVYGSENNASTEWSI